MDVLGLPVEEARRRLRTAGVSRVRETVTQPPRPVAGAQVWRVVREDVSVDGEITLVIAGFPDLPAGLPCRQ